MLINNTGYLQQQQGFRGLVYGRSGVGKTFLATTCPNVLVVATEPGLLSLRRYNIPYVWCPSLDTLRACAHWLATDYNAQAFQTVIIDSISETLEHILEAERKRVGMKEPRKAYGELVIQGLEVMRLFRDITTGHNVVFLAKQEKIQDADTGTILYGPKFPGKAVGTDAPYLFDFVLAQIVEKNFTTGLDERYFITATNTQYEAKDRSGLLFPKEPAHLDYIFRKIQGVI